MKHEQEKEIEPVKPYCKFNIPHRDRNVVSKKTHSISKPREKQRRICSILYCLLIYTALGNHQ